MGNKRNRDDKWSWKDSERNPRRYEDPALPPPGRPNRIVPAAKSLRYPSGKAGTNTPTASSTPTSTPAVIPVTTVAGLGNTPTTPREYGWDWDDYGAYSGYGVGTGTGTGTGTGVGAGAGAGGEIKTMPLFSACHKSPCEIHPGVFVGRVTDFEDAVKAGADLLIPLAPVYSEIWKYYDGDIWALPVADYQDLPADILAKKAKQVADMVKSGRKVAIGCMGGHGRTGYFAAAVLGLLGVEDPIRLLREKYCEKAVEADSQIKSLEALFPDALWIGQHKAAKAAVVNTYSKWGTGVSSGEPSFSKVEPSPNGLVPLTDYVQKTVFQRWDHCFQCKFYELKEECTALGIHRSKNDFICSEFTPFSEYKPAMRKKDCIGCGGEDGLVPGVVLEEQPTYDGDIPIHLFLPCPVCHRYQTVAEAGAAIVAIWNGAVLQEGDHERQVVKGQGVWADVNHPDLETLAALEELEDLEELDDPADMVFLGDEDEDEDEGSEEDTTIPTMVAKTIKAVVKARKLPLQLPDQTVGSIEPNTKEDA